MYIHIMVVYITTDLKIFPVYKKCCIRECLHNQERTGMLEHGPGS